MELVAHGVILDQRQLFAVDGFHQIVNTDVVAVEEYFGDFVNVITIDDLFSK